MAERCEEVLDWKVPGKTAAAGVSFAEAPAVPAAVGVVQHEVRSGTAAAAGGKSVNGKGGGGGGGGSGGGGKESGESSALSIKNYAIGAGVAIITAALSIVALDELELYDFY